MRKCLGSFGRVHATLLTESRASFRCPACGTSFMGEPPITPQFCVTIPDHIAVPFGSEYPYRVSREEVAQWAHSAP